MDLLGFPHLKTIELPLRFPLPVILQLVGESRNRGSHKTYLDQPTHLISWQLQLS